MSASSKINALLLGSQEIVNKAQEVITATQSTQRTLEKNIEFTEEKIDGHDHDEQSHDDLRNQLADLPSFITDPEVTGPSSSETGEENTWTFAAMGVIPTVEVRSYEIVDNHGVITNIPAGESSSTVFRYTFTGERNEEIVFTVQAIGTFNYKSKITRVPLTITQHIPPNLEGMSHNIPTYIQPGATYEIVVDGIVDGDDDLQSISLTSDNSDVIFRDGNIIQNGVPTTIEISELMTGPGLVNFTILATDARNMTDSRLITVGINTKPDISSASCNLPPIVLPETVYDVRLQGISDLQQTTLTCVPTSDNPAITFSTDSVTVGDIFQVIVGQVDAGTVINLNFVIDDGFKGITNWSYPVKINSTPITTDVVCTFPSMVAPGKSYTFIIRGGTDIDGHEVKYDIVNDNLDITYSKLVDIADEEIITVTFAEDMERATAAQQFSIQLRDSLGGRTPYAKVYHINQLPPALQLDTQVPILVKPNIGKDVTVLSPISNAYGTPFSFTFITREPASATVFPITGPANSTFTFTSETTASLPRGAEVIFDLVIDDGVEIFEQEIILRQNRLPDSTTITTTLDAEENMFGGSENAIMFSINGGVDPDNLAITYDIDLLSFDIQGAVLSKSTGIAAGETITLIVNKVSEDEIINLDIYAVDNLGERSATSKRVSVITVKPIMVVGAPSIIYPTEGDETVPYYDGFELTWSAAEIVPWVDMTKTFYPNNWDEHPTTRSAAVPATLIMGGLNGVETAVTVVIPESD